MENVSRSPLPWVGGKHYSADRILSAFPPPEWYETYVDVFGGAAHILLRKPRYRHMEVYNDRNKDLVNFWMQCRDHPQELQQQIESLPYARSLYDTWQESLFSDEPMSDMERAVRWFYVLRSSVGGIIRQSHGNWGYAVQKNHNSAQYIHSAVQLFSSISERFRNVQIECQDFEHILKTYERQKTFFYCDPPYIGVESYYVGIPSFTLSDHERLAQLLNKTSAKVALSYYPHEALDIWYPSTIWRRLTWQTYKHCEKTQKSRQVSTELLLLNYPVSQESLW